METLNKNDPFKLNQLGHFILDRIVDVRGGAWGDLGERYAGRIAFTKRVKEAEAKTPSNVIPFPKGVGIPPRPNRPRAA